MSALTNSLFLLNEIRDQLNVSKTSSVQKASPFKSSANLDKSGQIQYNDLAQSNNINTNLMHQYQTNTTATTDDEPLRQELNRRVMNSVGNTPPISQKIKIQDETTEAVSNFHPNQSSGNFEVSPYKRKVVSSRENSFANNAVVDRITQRSKDMAENLKVMLNKEIDSFSKECDHLKDRVQQLLRKKNSGISNTASRPPLSDNNFQLRGTRRNMSPSDKENMDSNAMTIIQRRMDKFVDDLEDKKNQSLRGTSIFDTLGMSSNAKKSERKVEYDTPSLSGTGKLVFD